MTTIIRKTKQNELYTGILSDRLIDLIESSFKNADLRNSSTDARKKKNWATKNRSRELFFWVGYRFCRLVLTYDIGTFRAQVLVCNWINCLIRTSIFDVCHRNPSTFFAPLMSVRLWSFFWGSVYVLVGYYQNTHTLPNYKRKQLTQIRINQSTLYLAL